VRWAYLYFAGVKFLQGDFSVIEKQKALGCVLITILNALPCETLVFKKLFN